MRKGAQFAELVEAVQARDEQAGVDGAGDARRVRDGGDHGNVEDVVDVLCRERAPVLDDDHHAVVSPRSGSQQCRQGDVAGASEHGETATWSGAPLVRVSATYVHDDDLGAGLGACCDAQPRGHLHRLVLECEGNADKRRSGERIVGDERRGPVLGVPVVATVAHSPRVARTIDAGLLVARLNRLHEFRELRALVQPRPTPDRAPSKSNTALLLPKVGKSRAHARCRVHPSHAHV